LKKAQTRVIDPRSLWLLPVLLAQRLRSIFRPQSLIHLAADFWHQSHGAVLRMTGKRLSRLARVTDVGRAEQARYDQKPRVRRRGLWLMLPEEVASYCLLLLLGVRCYLR